MKAPSLIVLVSRGLGFDKLHLKARDIEVKNSTIVITDIHGEAHYIPKTMWHSIEIKQPVGNVDVPQGAT